MHTHSNMDTNLNAQVGIFMNSFCYIMYNNISKVYNMYTYTYHIHNICNIYIYIYIYIAYIIYIIILITHIHIHISYTKYDIIYLISK